MRRLRTIGYERIDCDRRSQKLLCAGNNSCWVVCGEKSAPGACGEKFFIAHKKVAQRKLNAREAYESLVDRRAVGLDCSALTLLLQEESGSQPAPRGGTIRADQSCY
jgi:hypothetical protein